MRNEARIVWFDAADPAWVDGSLAGAIQDTDFFGDAGQSESGGSTADITVVAEGTGSAAETVSSGSDATVNAVAEGAGQAAEAAEGGATGVLSISPEGVGDALESVSGGSFALLGVAPEGLGEGEELAEGGSTVVVHALAQGAGMAPAEADGGGGYSEDRRVVLYPPRPKRRPIVFDEPEPVKAPTVDVAAINRLVAGLRASTPLTPLSTEALKASEQRLQEALRKVTAIRVRANQVALQQAVEVAEQARTAELAALLSFAMVNEELIADDEDAVVMLSAALLA